MAIFLLFLIGINALVAGYLFMTDPSGSKIGLSLSYLAHSPFRSYFIPGMILFIFNGVLNMFAGIESLRKVRYYPRLIMFQGLVLAGWISIQIWLVRDINPLHMIMFSIGLILMFSGYLILRIADR